MSLDLDAGDLVLARHADGRLLRALDFADPGEDVMFDPGELRFRDVAELELHLRLEQLFAERRVVLRLRLGGRDDLVENESQAADEERVEDEHTATGRGGSRTAPTRV